MALVFAFLIGLCMGYNKNNKLVAWNDNIEIYPTNDLKNSVINMKLKSFPYLTDVSVIKIIFKTLIRLFLYSLNIIKQRQEYYVGRSNGKTLLMNVTTNLSHSPGSLLTPLIKIKQTILWANLQAALMLKSNR